MLNCTYNGTLRWEDYPEPYEDIEGLGVLIGFLGTAWLMIAILVAYYLVLFDPELDPFSNAACQRSTEESETSFKPNPIDSMLLGFFRRCSRRLLSRLNCFGKGRRSFGLSRFQRSMRKCILNFVDLQLIAGLGLLISGFLSLNQGLSSYHWSIIVYLAWLSNITHLSGLTVLRGYFHSRQWERGWRLALMFLFMVLLLVALGPTAFFNRQDDTSSEEIYTFSIAQPRSLAICFFKPSESLEAYYEFEADQYGSHETHRSFSRSPAFQSTVVSMTLVVLNFFGRVLRIFPFVSKFFKSLRRRAHDQAKRALLKLSPTGRPVPRILNERQWLLIVAKPCLAVFLAVRFYVDLFISAQYEIYWLLLSGLWATLHLEGLRYYASSHRDNEVSTTWTFGQTLPVLMLLGPLITALAAFAGESESVNNRPVVAMELLDIPAGQTYESSNQIGHPTSIRTTEEGPSERQFRNDAEATSFLLHPRAGASPSQVPTQLEIDLQSHEPVWLQRNYYKTNWAPAICFWSCVQISTVGLLVVIFGTAGSFSPLALLQIMWVWALVAQPVATFALILIHVAGEEFQGVRKGLNRPVVCHGLAVVLYVISSSAFVASNFYSGIGLNPRLGRDLFAFLVVCAIYVPFIIFYVVLMFFLSK